MKSRSESASDLEINKASTQTAPSKALRGDSFLNRLQVVLHTFPWSEYNFPWCRSMFCRFNFNTKNFDRVISVIIYSIISPFNSLEIIKGPNRLPTNRLSLGMMMRNDILYFCFVEVFQF